MTASDSKSRAKRVAKAKAIDKDKLVTLMEAAAHLRVGRSTMQKLVRERKIRFFKIGRVLRIRLASIDKFIARLEKGAKL
jgi:excisionase family DNA binding protein